MHKLSKIYEEVNAECDCCQYFDMNSINDYVEYKMPLYALITKKRIGELKMVTPRQYIEKIAMGFGGFTYEEALQAYNDDAAIEYSEAMKNGAKFPVGYFTIGSSAQEGRHRAMAAMKLGCGKIPVMGMRDVSYDLVVNFANVYKGMSFERLNRLYISKGYKNGISQIGYNDLQRFIDYNVK